MRLCRAVSLCFLIYVTQKAMVHKIDDLFRRQLKSWPLLAGGMKGLAESTTRPVRIEWFDVFIRHIPHRIASATAAVDRESVLKRPCFLCADNLDPEEEGIIFNADFTIYCNPFPIVDRHLSIIHREHGAQCAMNVSVGLCEGRAAVEVELMGTFTDPVDNRYGPGRHRFTSEIVLTPSEMSSSAFALDDITIGIGFHWERKERQVFRGILRIIKRASGFTVINDVPLEDYVTSVISSEMSAASPLEFLKAHAVISRSWLWFPKQAPAPAAAPPPSPAGKGAEHEILRWYGREAHADFDVCADDHW